ncbi:MAG: 4Fe-4S binding protein, partial [Nitrospinota bacterium]
NRVSGAERQLPRKLRTLWPATALFFLLTWADGYWGIVRSPYATAWILIAFFVSAILLGALFARRTFCRYLCPIGGIMGLYSLIAPIELRPKSLAVCQGDPDKFCYTGCERGRGCPMFEFPQRMDSNAYCYYCGECLKTCARENLALRFRPFGRDLWTMASRRLDEAFLAVAMVAVAGMAAGHMVAPWHGWMEALGAHLPWAGLAHEQADKLTYTLVFWGGVALVPLAVYGAGALTWRLTGRSAKASPRRLFVRFGYAFVPLGLAMHLAHNLPHLFLEGPLVAPVFQKTVNLFTPWFIGAPDFKPAPWLELPVLQLLQTLILLAALLYSLYTAYRLSLAQWGAATFSPRGPWPYLALILLFTLANLYLLSLPMGGRHG